MADRKSKTTNLRRNTVFNPLFFIGPIIYDLVVGHWLFWLAGEIYHVKECVLKTYLGGIPSG